MNDDNEWRNDDRFGFLWDLIRVINDKIIYRNESIEYCQGRQGDAYTRIAETYIEEIRVLEKLKTELKTMIDKGE